MKYITAFFMAWGNFFAIPCPYKRWDNDLRRLQLMFFPLIGLLMGGLWYGLYRIFEMMGLPLPLQAAVLTVYPFAISGFIHLDGFMDCCDAILSRRDLPERQRILKDSHVGAFAVISVAILFLISFAALWSAMDPAYGQLEDIRWKMAGLMAIPLVSRACSAYAVLNFEPIGHSQYKASYDRQINRRYGILLIFMSAAAILPPFFCLENGFDVACPAAVTIIVHGVMTSHGRRQLGGMSGDISGYGLTVAECAGLLALAVL